jgi:hypothetical protein
MPAEWTCDRVRRFGIISVVFGLLGALQVVPLVGSLAAVTIGVLVIHSASDVDCRPTAAKVGVALGTVGMAIFAIALAIFIA